MPKGLSANLDFLRSVAVLLVLAQHLSRRTVGEGSDAIPTSHLGLFGVLIFFVHTSLVLMYSMERSGLRRFSLARDFYVRRIFRIYPLSILAVLAAVVLHLNSNINGIAGLSHGPLPGWKAILAQVLLVQNLVHVKSIVNVLWSLPFELQMYVFLPLPVCVDAAREDFLAAAWTVDSVCGRCGDSAARGLAWARIAVAFYPVFPSRHHGVRFASNRSVFDLSFGRFSFSDWW